MEEDQTAGYVSVLLDLVNDIADEVLAEQPKEREGIGEIMGGQVLTLASDRIAEEAKAKGKIEGGNEMLYKLVRDGDISVEKAAEKMRVSQKKFLDQMALCGFKVPENNTD